MTKEESFEAHLAARYAQEGWEVMNPEEARPALSFTPDLLLRRGGEHLVVEIKAAGYQKSRALDVIRNLVELQEGWHFEVKIVPPSWGFEQRASVPDEITARIKLSYRLLKENFVEEAYILAWTVLEALLRQLTSNDDKRVNPPHQLIREAFENASITADQLRILEVGIKIRSRIVHGISVDLSVDEVSELLNVVSSLTETAPQVS